VELTNIFTRFTSLATSSLATSGEQTPKEALDNMQAQMEDLYARNA
jgi:ABC-type glycerol-3-phosphate transport system substrate-binding protein